MPGKWHDSMENHFPKDMREIKFYCSSKVSNTCRRADIRLSKDINKNLNVFWRNNINIIMLII